MDHVQDRHRDGLGGVVRSAVPFEQSIEFGHEFSEALGCEAEESPAQGDPRCLIIWAEGEPLVLDRTEEVGLGSGE